MLLSPQAPKSPFVFERQRLPNVVCLEGQSRRELAQAVLTEFSAKLEHREWSLHAFAPDIGERDSFQSRVRGVVEALAEHGGAAWREAIARPDAKPLLKSLLVLQLCLTSGGLFASLEKAERLSSPDRGGVHHVGPGVRTPSRSSMKIEEALELFGESPQAGQRVVDLGAAPGGWSQAFLRRGCKVTAVDRAALQIDDLDELAGKLVHLREDGLRFRPQTNQTPVDWLLSDMLVPPGVTLGLLRKWLESGWTRRFIVNVKLPRQEAYRSVAPLEAFLSDSPGVRASIRQLHHDRREVTAWGTVTSILRTKAKRR
jgi:23S rRNA C2498 (ribose-2'-O)-methylase RlmM